MINVSKRAYLFLDRKLFDDEHYLSIPGNCYGVISRNTFHLGRQIKLNYWECSMDS